ncbi:hypothetical protein LRS12_17060 [Sphingomonas sp. J344]|uniref:hypothetical protein n=1 Tax=Sphingomonas sp. J344 TaxID=2898434 RepID=UPI0021512959|nr:hypothetical protein [Sphingomonas sp. J344]MCR5872265.1 hypothetical protein [Sphingomonas sp. J344]
MTDAELASAVLDIEDPMAVERLSRSRPDANLQPSIVGEYHRPVSEDALWCCHCQGHRHWNGFVVENETGNRYMIGSHCGPKHYELSFAAARRQHNELKQRQGLFLRLAAILAAEDELLKRITSVLQSDGLRRLDITRSQMKKSAGDIFFRLQPIALGGAVLTESVRVRDYAAEALRPANGKNEAPIYTFENQRIGPLLGASVLIEHGDCRDHLIALRQAVGEARKLHTSGTDSISTSQLQKTVQRCEEQLQQAQQAIAMARRAPGFFSDENVTRLERWSGQFDGFKLRRTEGGIEVITGEGGDGVHSSTC